MKKKKKVRIKDEQRDEKEPLFLRISVQYKPTMSIKTAATLNHLDKAFPAILLPKPFIA